MAVHRREGKFRSGSRTEIATDPETDRGRAGRRQSTTPDRGGERLRGPLRIALWRTPAVVGTSRSRGASVRVHEANLRPSLVWQDQEDDWLLTAESRDSSPWLGSQRRTDAAEASTGVM